ncbi:MAG: hypothetical protein IJW26_04605 [Clostridia bacterium]|nr:hypothetical protein [Clostridia bacterium]
MKSIYWEEIFGTVTVTARGIDENDEWQTFTFDCYVSEEVHSYTKLENILDTAYHLALLRNLYHSEVLDVKIKVVK